MIGVDIYNYVSKPTENNNFGVGCLGRPLGFKNYNKIIIIIIRINNNHRLG